jgi:hypothetical protein
MTSNKMSSCSSSTELRNSCIRASMASWLSPSFRNCFTIDRLPRRSACVLAQQTPTRSASPCAAAAKDSAVAVVRVVHARTRVASGRTLLSSIAVATFRRWRPADETTCADDHERGRKPAVRGSRYAAYARIRCRPLLGGGRGGCLACGRRLQRLGAAGGDSAIGAGKWLVSFSSDEAGMRGRPKPKRPRSVFKTR